MGGACGKSKQPKEKNTPKDNTNSNPVAATTTQTQTQPQNTNPTNQQTVDSSKPNIQPTQSQDPQRRPSLSKMIVQSSINLANKMNSGMFTALTSMEDIRRRYRFEPKVYGKFPFLSS